MSAIPIAMLLQQSESSKLDFKRASYAFPNGTEIERSELLKDILAIANADRDADGYIVLGVADDIRRAVEIVGVEPTISDHVAQEFVNSKTNRPVRFSIEHISHDSKTLTLISIAKEQARPIFLRKAYGRLEKNKVVIRRGSSTTEASPDEVAEFGKKAQAPTTVANTDVSIRFLIVVETWRYEPLGGGFPDERRNVDTELLEIIAVNSGDTLLQYVQGSLTAPRGILLDYIKVSEIHTLPEKMDLTDVVKIKFNNKLSEPGHHALAAPKPAEWRPLSPGMELPLLREKVIPIGRKVTEIPAEIHWEVGADACRLKRGSIRLNEIEFVDRRKKRK